MTIDRRLLRTALMAAAVAVAAAAGSAFAQAYPTRAIKLVVPYPAGGSTDQIARMIAAPMARSLGQPIYIENVGGGNTMIGSLAVARAAPDGYTILLNSLAYSVVPLTSKTPAYHPVEDFIPVAGLTSNAWVMSANLQVPATTVNELVEYARRNPAKVNAVSLGIGSVTHLLNARFASVTGVPFTSVPYRGAAPALVDLLSGQVQFFLDIVSTSLPHVRSGKLRPLAVTSPERSPLMPDVPTFRELGYRKMTQDAWFGLFAPKGTPQAIVDRLNAEAQKSLATPEVQAAMARDGMRAASYTPAQFAEFIKEDAAGWKETVKTLNLQLD